MTLHHLLHYHYVGERVAHLEAKNGMIHEVPLECCKSFPSCRR